MAQHKSASQESSRKRIAKFLIRLLFVILYPAIILGLLLLCAGTISWIEAWLFSLAYLVYFIFYLFWGTIRAPDLMDERTRPKKNAKKWDIRLMRFGYTPLLVILLISCGLDKRFAISIVPIPVEIAGGLLALCSGAWIFWVLDTNRFASGVVRIQEDRGHVVVSSGPYGIVRHPMYIGNIVFISAIPLILGSWVGLVPGGLICALFVVRTALEDRTLTNELSGYADYAKRVTKRLLPGIW